MIGAYIVGEPATHPARIVRDMRGGQPRERDLTCTGCGRAFTKALNDGSFAIATRVAFCTRACYQAHWRRTHPGRSEEINRKSVRNLSPEQKATRRAKRQAWAEANVESVREYRRRERWRQRAMVLEHYGGRCACCGETEPAFLGMDHINGGGRQHRQTFSGSLTRWLHRNGFPEGFQVLCHNCNQAKHIMGECPHASGLAP